MNDIKVMNHAADNIRILAASMVEKANSGHPGGCLLYTSPSPRDGLLSRMPSSA